MPHLGSHWEAMVRHERWGALADKEAGETHSREHDMGDHNNIQIPVVVNTTPTVWTNMPAAETDLFGDTGYQFRFAAQSMRQARITARQKVAGATDATLKLQHFVNSAFTDSGPSLAVGAGTGTKTGTFANLADTAIADRIFRLVGVDGDATADPEFGSIIVHFR